MAVQSRGADPSLEQELFKHGYRFDFFQAVRLLARMSPDRHPVGKDASPSEEAVRFRSHTSLAFPPSAIHEIRENRRGQGPVEMTVAFMGLTGPLGVLPRHYTELLLERIHAKDHTLREFFDLFNHRMISLFYQAWQKHHYVVGHEQALLGREQDSFAHYLFALMGMGTKGLREKLGGADRTLLRYAGALAQRPRSANALEQCLSDHFEVPAKITQFIGMRLSLQEADWTCLGASGGNNILGRTAVAGTSVWDQQAKFHVRLGPLDFTDFYRLLPSGEAYPTLVQLTKFAAGPDLDFDVNPILKAAEVPECRLHHTHTYSPRLGWTTWLKTLDFGTNAEDVSFTGSLTAAQIGTA